MLTLAKKMDVCAIRGRKNSVLYRSAALRTSRYEEEVANNIAIAT